MFRKVLGIVVIVLAWLVVIAYIVYASRIAKMERAEQIVEEVVVNIVDSTAMCHFTTSADVRRKLQHAGFAFEKKKVESIDVVSAVKLLNQSGYIDKASIYVTSSGRLVVNIDQHEPFVRFLTKGYNSYITSDGHTFRSPEGSSYYAAVITGSFRPLFAPNFEGNIESHYGKLVEEQRAKSKEMLSEIRNIRQRERRCIDRRAKLRKSRRKGFFESKKRHEQRLIGVESEILACENERQQLRAQRRVLENRQPGVVAVEQRIAKQYREFRSLLNFVEEMESDNFWGAEIVQYVADTTSQGDIRLRLIPRSGDFTIEFGTLAMASTKMEKLRKFYDDGLSHMGWERFSKIDLRYNNQIICTE